MGYLDGATTRAAILVGVGSILLTCWGCVGAGARSRSIPAPEVARIDVAQAASALAEDGAIAVDIRPYRAFLRNRIKGARSLPYSDLLRRLDELPRNKLLITYCA